ncbi:ATP-dependent nuclease [Pedobacter nanyangensis]|uniref:ATP-dependent nuclease n=1 Tax=Pedobacter nanyangensis TaxID=1562389 RepID=UPI000DE551D1|nr:AAA family ATPase [Pedobacter nanyangensis]
MYISKLFLKNFRSFKESTIEFSKGKNVIVGKNNCGKSNIVKALDMLIGEKFPTYLNITENDFYCHEEPNPDTGEIQDVVEDNFYIEVTIEERDINKDLIATIIKNIAFSKVDNISSIYSYDGYQIKVNYNLLQNLDVIAENPAIVANERNHKTTWMKGDALISFIEQSTVIKIFFTKSLRTEDASGYGLILKNNNEYWLSHFVPKKLRDALITSTVINSLRSPKEDLRVVNYTWFGKLISKIWNDNKNTELVTNKGSYIELILGHSEEIKMQVDKLFFDNTEEIRKVISQAIAHQKVSFKLYNDNPSDIYKNVQIFINDGIDRAITEKGTGIQSAVIIALFSLYCNKFHATSSLLITEEPEVFLHPQARRIISAELNNYLNDKTQRQLIISTHSIEFLKGVDPSNIIRVFKSSENNYSQVSQIKRSEDLGISQEIKRFLWSNNTEIFFSDMVILVEGGENYLLPSAIDKLKKTKQYLDYKNISVARVNGKGNFLSYIKMLNAFKIKWILIGDLDCYKDVLQKILSFLNLPELTSELEKIKGLINVDKIDPIALKERLKGVQSNLDAQQLLNIFEKFQNGTIEKTDDELASLITYMQERYIKSDLKQELLTKVGENRFNKFQKELNTHNIFIWSNGDLEKYYTKAAKAKKGSKDIIALELSYAIADDGCQLTDYIQPLDEWQEISDKI